MYDPSVVTMLLPFDPFDPAFRHDPYPVYHKLRETGAVSRTPAGGWVVTGHQECSSILRDPRFGWGDGMFVADQFTVTDDGTVVRPFIFMDPPDHTRIRSLVSKAFAVRRVERLRPRAEQVMAQLLADATAAAGDGPVDLVSAISYPLPAILLAELLGVPKDNLDRFREWSSAIGRGLDPFVMTVAESARRDDARGRFDAYFAGLAEHRRADPTDDLVSALVSAEHDGDRLTGTELVTTCRLLLSAGHVTTFNWITNGVLALLRHPDQLAWLRAHPDRVASVADELLRYDPPIQMISRVALTEVDVAGQTIGEGESVLLVIAAGNRDPAAYPDPDRLDVSRQPGRNLGFGLGIHFCIGAPIARLTAEVAFAALAARDIELATDTPTRSNTFVVRGLTEMPVLIGPGSAE